VAFRLLRFIPLLFFVSIFTRVVYAHCPLCTVGAGAAAVGAKWLGVSNIIVGVFIGAFAFALGFWMNRLIRKNFFRYQPLGIAFFSYFLTIIPLMPIMQGYSSFYLSFFGEYGSIFNRTYVFNSFIGGSIVGGLVVLFSPFLSRRISHLMGHTIPFQGTAMTFILLILVSVGLEVIL